MFQRRVLIVLGMFILAAGAVLARLAVLQAAGPDAVDTRRFMQTGGDRIVQTVRGGIHTRYGKPLAVQVPSFDLGVYYGNLSGDDWQGAVTVLTGVSRAEIGRRAEAIVARVERLRESVCRRNNNPDLHVPEEYEYYSIAEDISARAAATVRAEQDRYPALRVLECSTRQYPNGSLAPHIVGVMSRIDKDTWRRLGEEGRTWRRSDGVAAIGRRYTIEDPIGESGVELHFEELLRGERGHVINRLSIGLLKVHREQEVTPPVSGADVYLTVREDFQQAANAALEWASGQPELDFDAGALIVLDVNSGAVLAAATWPNYDLATYRQDYPELLARSGRPLWFRPFKAQLPAGSVFKIATAIAALMEGKITSRTTHTCHRVITFSGRPFRCEGLHNEIALVPAIEKSCNIYFYLTGLLVGAEKLAEWGRRLGIGVPTGLDVYESFGRLDAPGSRLGTVNLSIGQGEMLCTPLQVAMMMGAVANGGRVYTPHVFHHAIDPDGRIMRAYEPQYREVDIRTDVLQVVREGMRRVTETGTARTADLARFKVAGKTGTAQTGRRDEGERYHAWFAGYAPWDEPKIAFAVVNEHTRLHGGEAAPIIWEFLWRVWDEIQQID